MASTRRTVSSSAHRARPMAATTLVVPTPATGEKTASSGVRTFGMLAAGSGTGSGLASGGGIGAVIGAASGGTAKGVAGASAVAGLCGGVGLCGAAGLCGTVGLCDAVLLCGGAGFCSGGFWGSTTSHSGRRFSSAVAGALDAAELRAGRAAFHPSPGLRIASESGCQLPGFGAAGAASGISWGSGAGTVEDSAADGAASGGAAAGGAAVEAAKLSCGWGPAS